MRTFPIFLTLFSLLLPGMEGGGQDLAEKFRSDRFRIRFEVSSLPDLNTEASEFSPFIYEDKLIFTSNRESNYLDYGMNRWERNAHLSLFRVELGSLLDSVDFQKVEQLSSRINTRDHTGPLCFTDDGKKAFITRVSGGGKSEVKRPSLFSAQYQDKTWEKVRELDFTDPEHSYAHPTISPDQKKLFFTSDMKGKGGKDIFYSVKKEGSWSKPIDLGAPINTEGNEMFPYYRDSLLIFSSNGRDKNFGKLDLYISSEKPDGSWSKPVNLGKSINSAGDDFGIVFNKNMSRGYFSSDRDSAIGSDDIFKFRVIEKVVVEKPNIEGQFNYRELEKDVPKGLKVQAVDESGTVIATTETGKKGQFKFQDLPPDHSYTVSLKERLGEDLKLTVYKRGKKRIFLISDERGKFIYRELSPDQTGTLSLMDEEDVDMEKNTGSFSGQMVYDQLPSDHPDDISVKLVNDKGEVVYETTTDEKGNFKFEGLPLDKNLTIKVETEEDLTAYIYDRAGKVKAQLKPNKQGEFLYRRLMSDQKEALAMADTVNVSGPVYEPPKSTKVLGRLRTKEDDKALPEELWVEAIGDNGRNFRKEVKEDGYFRFSGLPASDSLRFKAHTFDRQLLQEMEVLIIDREGKVVERLDVDAGGSFVYHPLKRDRSGLTRREGTDKKLEAIVEKGETISIYYDYNSSRLRPRSAKILKKTGKKLKENPKLELRIHSYTDSRGPKPYNLELSKKRTRGVIQYLIRRGIDKARLSGEGHGEEGLVNECSDGVECPEEKHQVNRRTEIQFIRPDQ